MRRVRRALLFLVFDGNRLQIFGFEDLAAVQTLYVIDPITPGEDYGAGMLTNALHNQYGKYSTGGKNPVKSPAASFYGPFCIMNS
jgi:hypothetical protein